MVNLEECIILSNTEVEELSRGLEESDENLEDTVRNLLVESLNLPKRKVEKLMEENYLVNLEDGDAVANVYLYGLKKEGHKNLISEGKLYLPVHGKSVLTIGRLGGNDLVPLIEEERDTSVSRKHGSVEVIRANEDAGFYIGYRDDSTNGSFFNDIIRFSKGKVTPFDSFSFVSFGSNVYNTFDGEGNLNNKRPRNFRIEYSLTNYGKMIGINSSIIGKD